MKVSSIRKKDTNNDFTITNYYIDLIFKSKQMVTVWEKDFETSDEGFNCRKTIALEIL